MKPTPKAKAVPADAEEKELRKNLSHGHGGTLATTTLAGAAAGVATGALVGPVGAVVGGFIGAAIGTAAGEIMEEEAEKASVHDAELDREIGVTEGPIGVASMKKPLVMPEQEPAKAASDDENSAEWPFQEVK